MSDFDPHSTDAMFSRLMTEITALRTTQLENRDKLDTALQRISALESFKIWTIGMAAGVSSVVVVVFTAVKWLLTDKH